MRNFAAVVTFALLCAGTVMASSSAYAGDREDCNRNTGKCYQTYYTPGKILRYKEVRVPVRGKAVAHKKEVPCTTCAPQQPTEIMSPPPETVTVTRKVFVQQKDEIIYLPPKRIVVQPPPLVCCPPGTSSTLPPCPPGVVGGNYGGDPSGQPVVASNFPYKPGAPRSPEECQARGGRDLGWGCTGYH